jgi:aminoglycoside-2''-adenylyltransferase
MHQDFKELLSAFNAGQVRYLIVGGYAVSFHAQPRATKDLDILIGADTENSKAVYAALSKFGAPLEGLSAKELRAKGREDWVKLREQTGENSRDPQDRSAERNQDTEPKDLPRRRDKGLDDDLNE